MRRSDSGPERFSEYRLPYPTSYHSGSNSMRFLAMSPRNNHLQVEGVDNLFCGGEKAGILVGITEAICTGTLAGHNAARYAMGKDLVELPRSLAVGDM
ncbi:MAG: FAD-dependent oxidoreductase, partial [Rhodothermales bacterium]|nr:FAD-dependent oxidoreductase [Rhodothermales bacterium]